MENCNLRQLHGPEEKVPPAYQKARILDLDNVLTSDVCVIVITGNHTGNLIVRNALLMFPKHCQLFG